MVQVTLREESPLHSPALTQADCQSVLSMVTKTLNGMEGLAPIRKDRCTHGGASISNDSTLLEKSS